MAGRGLVTGGFLLCGWLVTSAGHAAAAETATPAAPHDLVTAASQITGSGTTRPVLSSAASLPGAPSRGSQRPASTLLALPSFPGQAGVGAGNQIVPSLGSLTRPAGVTATGRLARAGTSASSTSAASAVTSQPGRPLTSAVTPLAARPGAQTSSSVAVSGLIDQIRTAGCSLAAPLPALASKPVASIPGAAGLPTIVPAGVNPGGVNQPAGALPGSQPLMRMAPHSVTGPARTANPVAGAVTLAPIPAAAAQLTEGWARQAAQQDAGTPQPAIPHRTVPDSGKPGTGAATQTDPVPAGGSAGAAQMVAHVPSGSGHPNPAGWLIRMRVSRSPAGLQRADDPSVSPD